MSSSSTTPAPKLPDIKAKNVSGAPDGRHVIVQRKATLRPDPLDSSGSVPHRMPQLVGDSVTENSLVHASAPTTATNGSASERLADKKQRHAEALDAIPSGMDQSCGCSTCGPAAVLGPDASKQALQYILGQDNKGVRYG